MDLLIFSVLLIESFSFPFNKYFQNPLCTRHSQALRGPGQIGFGPFLEGIQFCLEKTFQIDKQRILETVEAGAQQ